MRSSRAANRAGMEPARAIASARAHTARFLKLISSSGHFNLGSSFTGQADVPFARIQVFPTTWEMIMNGSNHQRDSLRDSQRARKLPAARRLVLLGSAAALAVTVLVAGPGGYHPQALSFGATAHAAAAAVQQPAGFADLVARVKPAVIS